MRRPVIGVMGGSKATDQVVVQAECLGELIAQRGWVLLNGGRDCGVMSASARGAQRAIAKGANGLVVGILPDTTTTKASPDLDVAIVTGLGDGRNLINVMSSDVVIACPGSMGTLSEIILALKRGKPVILLGDDDLGPRLDRFRRRGQLMTADTPDEAIVLAGTFHIDPID